MHEGHRKRMYEKLKSGDKLYDHELLEILLFNAYARKNTNPIAHALLDTFVTIPAVLNASVEELCAVEGVGESVALYLRTVGECTKNIRSASDAAAVLYSYEDFKNYAALRLKFKTQEILELYCLEKNGRLKKTFTYTSNENSKVEVSSDKIAQVLATVKPYGLFIAHNHLSGDSRPSVNDDRFTMEVQLLCSMNNVQLYDHCIYASDKNIYSYFAEGKLDEIKRKYSFKSIIDEKFKNDK